MAMSLQHALDLNIAENTFSTSQSVEGGATIFASLVRSISGDFSAAPTTATITAKVSTAIFI